MVIDHLIPKSKGGPDSFENFVLTYKDLNLGKSNKHDDELERMRWTVKMVYAPRARKLYDQFRSTTKCSVKTEYEETHDIVLKHFKTRFKAPHNLHSIQTEDLFWAKDKKIKIFSDSQYLTDKNAYEVLKALKTYTNVARQHNSDYCIDVWLTKELAIQLKSVWYCVDGNYFKTVRKTEYYDSDSPDKWAYVYFTSHYLKFFIWRDEINDFLEKIFEIDDGDEHKKLLRKFCTVFPPPEEYAHEMLE